MSDPNPSTDDQPNAPDPPSPLGEQVAVFVASAVLSGFVMYMLPRSLLPMLAKGRADLGDALTFLPIVASLAGLGIWIGMYSVFPRAPLQKVIPWMWAAGGLFVAAEILITAQDLARLGLQPPIGFYVSITGGMVALVLLFQAWFRKKGRLPART